MFVSDKHLPVTVTRIMKGHWAARQGERFGHGSTEAEAITDMENR